MIMVNAEFSISVFRNLSTENQAAWAKCAMFSQLYVSRVGNTVSKFDIVSRVCELGQALSTPDGLGKYLYMNGAQTADSLRSACNTEYAATDKTGRTDFYNLPELEFGLFWDVVGSGLMGGLYDVLIKMG